MTAIKKILCFICLLSCMPVVAARDARGDVSAPFPQDTSLLSPRDTLLFEFKPGRELFYRNYRRNAFYMDSLSRFISLYRPMIESGELKIRVLGLCASFGTAEENLKLAKKRSNRVKSHFILGDGMKEEYFSTANRTCSWNGKRDVVLVTYMPQTIADTEVADTASPTPAIDPLPETVQPRPVVETVTEKTIQTAGAVTRESGTVVEEAVVEKRETAESAPGYYRWGIKTNVAYLTATVANLGVEYCFGSHYSVDVPVIYSPYTVARNYRLRLLAVQPEFRYWLKQPAKGHFFGVHLNIGAFNISVDKKKRYQSPDGFYGAGISYGYVLPFAKQWAAEFMLGVGYIHTKYDTYYNIPNGARFEKGISYNYWGLTKVGISLVYRFGR